MNDDQELRKRVEETVDRVIEKMIVEEVLKLCAALPRDCLAVFHGSNQGFDCALRSLAAMKQRMNVRFRAAVAPAARELLPEKMCIRDSGSTGMPQRRRTGTDGSG